MVGRGIRLEKFEYESQQKLAIFDVNTMSKVDGPNRRVVVFLQGCMFNCDWCHSPHSRPQISPLLYNSQYCSSCKRCEKHCKNGVHRFHDKIHSLDRNNCIACGDCIAACPNSKMLVTASALTLPTYTLSPEELFQKIKPYLNLCSNDGGVTLSGGEALQQLEPVKNFLQICKQNNIHTAIETSGLLDHSIYESVMELVDVWLFGVRVVTRLNQAPNLERIRRNLNTLVHLCNATILPRIPMVPGVMDNLEVLYEIKNILFEYGIDTIDLCPWNQFFSHYYILSGIQQSFREPNDLSIAQCHKTIQSFFIENGFKFYQTKEE